MSNETPETPIQSPEAPSPELSAQLAEAKATRDVLVRFADAIKDGEFRGADAMNIAKGLAFLDAIILQNQAHVEALEAKVAK